MFPLAAAASEPGPIQTIYVIPSAHWDLGFLRPPDAEEDAIKPHLDAVIAACEADPQFRWTIESVWQLDAWLDRTKDQAQIKRLADLLHSGKIELSAVYGSTHTEFMGSEELNRLVSAGSQTERRLGIHPEVAMINDVPGFSMRLPQVLARSGIPYLITGSNTGLGGGAQLWPGKVPFRWESPDGSGVLTWQTQGKNGGYTEGMTDYYLDPDAKDPYLHTKFYPKEWTGLSNLEIMQRGIDKLLKQYTDAGYRGSAVAVFFMHDGIGPEDELKGLLPNVRAWNASGRSPRLVVATPSEFFRYLAGHGAQSAPVYRGDWSGLWSAVKLNSPAMSADARALQSLLPQTETLWSLLTMEHLAAQYPAAQIEADYRDLFVYDEHNGAGQGGWPKVLSYQEVLEQNKEYSEKLREARDSAAVVMQSGLADLAADSANRPDHSRSLLVYNPSSWSRSQLVRIPNMPGAWTVRDLATGSMLPSQSLQSGELVFEARDVPSVGYRTYQLDPASPQNLAPISLNPAILESPWFRVELDPDTGDVLSITDLHSRRVVMAAKDGGHAGTLLLNSSVYRDTDTSHHAVLTRERGAVVDQIVVERPGSLWPRTVIRLPQSEPVIYLTEILDRSKMRFVGHGTPQDRYSFAFDFSSQGKVQHWVDDGEGLYRFPEELLPGARTDAVVPRHTLVWSENVGNSSYSIMLAQKQAFFDRFQSRSGATAGGSWSTDGALAEVMVKSDQAETRDHGISTFESYEPGYPSTYPFTFSLTAGDEPADPVAAHQFGVQEESDFIELPIQRGPAKPSASLLSFNASNVVLEAIQPSSDGKPDDFLLRLQEIAGKPTDLSLYFPLPIRSIAKTTLTEDRVLQSGIQADAIHLSPGETLTLRLSIAHPVGNTQGKEN